MLLKNKVCVITGAAGGIGSATALACAQEGAKVVLIQHQKAAEEVSQKIKESGGESFIFTADVTNLSSVELAVKQIIERLGHIDVWINNAGITSDSLLLRMKEEEWDRVLDTNLKGVFNCTKSVLKFMIKKRQGKIINISSVVGIIGNPGQANYAAAKAGIIGFSKAVAKEVASRNICVNVVAPGYIQTPMTENLSEEDKTKILSLIPLLRLGTPEDVANTIVFLASDKANYITGQVLVVDGGLIM